MNIHLIDRSAAKGQAREEMIDSLLVTAEEEAGKRFWALLHLKNGRIDVLVREDRQKRPKDLVLHDWIVPGHGIKDGRIDVARFRVRRTTGDDLLLINEPRQALNSFRADDARVVGIVLRIGPVELDHCLLALRNEFPGNGFVHMGVTGRGTPLAAPSHRAPDNFLGGIRKISGRIDKRWVLAPE